MNQSMTAQCVLRRDPRGESMVGHWVYRFGAGASRMGMRALQGDHSRLEKKL